MVPVGIENIAEVARTLPRDQFARRFPGCFFVVTDPGEDEQPISFETVEAGAAQRALQEARSHLDVYAIAKAANNPYQDRISIGRARNCDVVLRFSSVSKLHAHFRPTPDGPLELVDLDSQNGTRVNGRALSANQPQRVAAGDIVQIGRVIGRLTDAAALWDLLRAFERVGSVPPPAGSVPPPAGSRP
jgi:hypothetical protein